ncbi:hypothetical protein AALA69_03345 [Eggerthellaceae bacterium 24-137]
MIDEITIFSLGIFACIIARFVWKMFKDWIDCRIREGVAKSYDVDMLARDIKRLAEWQDEEDAAICALYVRLAEVSATANQALGEADRPYSLHQDGIRQHQPNRHRIVLRQAD